MLQLLVTFAVFMILEDVLRLIWGAQPLLRQRRRSTRLGTIDVVRRHLHALPAAADAAVALVAYGLLQYFLRSTRTGKQIIAVDRTTREVATAMGIDAKRIRLVTFILGAVLGALGGALASPTTSLVPGVGADMIVLSFAVVATAGLGQITGRWSRR